MGFGTAITTCLRNYATFSGRARRAEFWLFYLFTLFVGMIGFAVVMVTALTMLPTSEADGDPSSAGLVAYFVVLGLVVLVSIALTIPLYAAWARRLHDMGQSGHWLWLNLVSLAIVPLVMAFMDSEWGANRWGPDPKAAQRGLGAYGGYGQPGVGHAPYGQVQDGQAPAGQFQSGHPQAQPHHTPPGHQPPPAQ